MSLHNGTAAETERKKTLEQEGHIILNLGQNQYGDLEDVCHNIVIEVKTSKNKRRDLSKKEKVQMENLLALSEWRTVRYDIRFHGNGHHPAVWQSEFPQKIVSSFRLRDNCPMDAKDELKSIVINSVNKNRKVKL